MLGSVMSQMVNIVSYVLIAFTSISLVVSAVMISIITSISVLERTKEIGILRSIGARKKDVTRLFNAENVILGVFAGLIGVIVTGLLTFPINLILSAVAGVSGIAAASKTLKTLSRLCVSKPRWKSDNTSLITSSERSVELGASLGCPPC